MRIRESAIEINLVNAQIFPWPTLPIKLRDSDCLLISLACLAAGGKYLPKLLGSLISDFLLRCLKSSGLISSSTISPEINCRAADIDLRSIQYLRGKFTPQNLTVLMFWYLV